MAKIFPAVRPLNVEKIATNSGNLTPNFLHLEYLTLPKSWTTNQSNYEMLIQTLELNHQIQHLGIAACDWAIVKILNKILPNIESLRITELIFKNGENLPEPLRFSNVKRLVCFGSSSQNYDEYDRIPLAFGNLDLITFSRSDLTPQWINIMLENKNLRKIFTWNGLNDTQLLQIAEGLPNLEELHG